MRKLEVRNTSGSNFTVNDVRPFVTIRPAETVDLLTHYSINEIARSAQLKDAAVAGTLVVLDADSNDITHLAEAGLYVDNLYARQIEAGNAPVSSTDTGIKGEVRATATHMYWCINKDTWRRIPWETF